MRIVLVGCGAAKLSAPAPAKAKDLYCGSLFRTAKQCAERIGDSWFILSAKYGILSPNALITPYDYCLSQMNIEARLEWANKINDALIRIIPKDSCVIGLAAAYYLEHIRLPHGLILRKPLNGLRLPHRINAMKRML